MYKPLFWGCNYYDEFSFNSLTNKYYVVKELYSSGPYFLDKFEQL